MKGLRLYFVFFTISVATVFADCSGDNCPLQNPDSSLTSDVEGLGLQGLGLGGGRHSSDAFGQTFSGLSFNSQGGRIEARRGFLFISGNPIFIGDSGEILVKDSRTGQLLPADANTTSQVLAHYRNWAERVQTGELRNDNRFAIANRALTFNQGSNFNPNFGSFAGNGVRPDLGSFTNPGGSQTFDPSVPRPPVTGTGNTGTGGTGSHTGGAVPNGRPTNPTPTTPTTPTNARPEDSRFTELKTKFDNSQINPDSLFNQRVTSNQLGSTFNCHLKEGAPASLKFILKEKETETGKKPEIILDPDPEGSSDKSFLLSLEGNQWKGAAGNITVSAKAVELGEGDQKKTELVWHITEGNDLDALCIEQK